MRTEILIKRYPNNRIFTDAFGHSSVMVRFQKFYMDEVIDGAPHVPHPAFLQNGRCLDCIYVSKFQNVVIDGRAYSLPDLDPATHIDFDTARETCAAMGSGFHLMTAMEWGAIALWCQKNGFLPFGNNDLGRDVRETYHTATVAYCDEEHGICRVATGSGPVTWSHDRTSDGIYDLNGNVWEWSNGVRLVCGELQLSAVVQRSDTKWYAINGTTGALIEPDGLGTTPNSIKLDFVNGAWQFITGCITDAQKKARYCDFSSMTAHESITSDAKLLLYALGFLPLPSYEKDYEGVAFYANNGATERMVFRGGRWGQGQNAGLWKTCIDDPRTYTGDAVGFRSVFIE